MGRPADGATVVWHEALRTAAFPAAHGPASLLKRAGVRQTLYAPE